MFRTLFRASAFAALLASFAVSAHATNVDPADVTFWQSVQNSKNPAEYQAYLNAFPHGVFVDVAKVRIQEYGAAGGGGSTLGPVVGRGIITVTPAAIDVGEKIGMTFAKFPKPGQFDWIIVDPAGTPDTASLSANLGGSYASLIPLDVEYKLGPFPPGSYEVRWLTTLYNSKNELQVGARTAFSVNP